jgi:hypothetical protein
MKAGRRARTNSAAGFEFDRTVTSTAAEREEGSMWIRRGIGIAEVGLSRRDRQRERARRAWVLRKGTRLETGSTSRRER